MALQVADRIQQTGTANTTVSFTLSATTVGYQAFSPAITTGNTTYYSANDGTNWEVGIGTLTNSTTLTRTVILSSSNSGSAVSTFGATVTIFCDYPAGKSVIQDANGNVSNNTFFDAYSNTAAAGTTTTLTASSIYNYVVTGSGGQTFKLPDATTLPSGAIYTFNNNQSSGTIVVQNNSSTTVVTIQSGGFVELTLLSNAIAAGSWDTHYEAPSNVSWSTNTLDYAGSITSATWNGTAVAINRGGTGQTTASAAFNALSPMTTAGDIIYGGTSGAGTRLGVGTTGQILTVAGGVPTWATSGSTNAYTRTSFTATAGQTTFTVSYTVGYVEVYVNGVLLNGADYTATNGTSVVLAVGRATNDIVETIAFATGTVTPTNLSVGTSLVQGGTSGYVLYNNAGVVGNLATTGSGSVVLGTSPTIATPTITSLYGQNSNLVTTPYRDAGLIPAELIYRLNSTYVTTATTSAQSLFGVGVTVSGSTVYQFEAVYAFSKSATASAHNISLLFGGTATINNIGYSVIEPASTLTSFTDYPNGSAFMVYIQTASATVLTAPVATAAIYRIYLLKGTVSINAGGTFIPQFQTSVSVGPYTTAIGSYFKLSPMSASGANTSIGTWA